MTETEFINKVDWEGGLLEGLDWGLKENDLQEGTKLWSIVREVRLARADLKHWIDEYYDYCESCRHEEE